MTAEIAEIFKSIQGEGIYQGETQIFVRLYGCNLSCVYCDTKIEKYTQMSSDEVMAQVAALEPCRFVSITGGEPLVQAGFVRELAQKLKEKDYKVYLETNGVLFEELKKVIDFIDVVSMDFKLPSATQHKDTWSEHIEFLKISCQKEVYVKAVVAPQTQISDILEVIKALRGHKDVPLVLQPQYPHEDTLKTKLAFYKMLCRLHGFDARIMIQLHKKLGLR
jgi:organic radical activating enzyme